jgi:hypothetical protein
VKLRCMVCDHRQDGEHLAVRCEGCGARQSMTFAPVAGGLRPGEPIVGMSRAPITRLPLSQMRGPYDEPLEVTRERNAHQRTLVAVGVDPLEAYRRAEAEVPIQCGRCGGEDAGCNVCLGRATAPTEALAHAKRGRLR